MGDARTLPLVRRDIQIGATTRKGKADGEKRQLTPQTIPAIVPTMDTEGAAAFWSYTHRDHDAEDGRISQLAHDLQKEYGLLTSGELKLFLDRDAIEWGDNLRGRIDEALSETTFFIPIITPSYFTSAECRRELIAFAQGTKRLRVESLLLPIYYVDVPELSGNDQPSDEVMQIVNEYKREDWRKLRLEDRSSSQYRKGVHQLAQRLADVMRDLTTQPPPVVQTATGDKEILPNKRGTADVPLSPGEVDAEEPGVLDLIAEGEQAMPELAKIASELAPEIEKIGEITKEAADEMNKSNAKGLGASQGLKITAKMANKLVEPAKKILELGQQYAAALVKVDPAISAMIGLIEADPKSALEQDGTRDYIKTIRSMVESGRQGTVALQELSTSLSTGAGFSRVLRPVIRDIQAGLRGFVDGQAIYNEWDKRLEEIEENGDKQ